WFEELAGRSSGLPLRRAARALVLDHDGHVLLVRFALRHKEFWATPGGGVDPGEIDEAAIVRELAEECGLRGFELGPCIWTPERLGAELDPRRGLAALVLGAVDHRDRTLDYVAVEAVGRELLAGAVLLDVGLEHAVERGVRRQRVLVELVGAQLGARRAVDD